MMTDQGCNLGGEPSGHVILSDYLTTGDGLLAAIQVLSLLKKRHLKASYIFNLFSPVPQVLKNLRLTKPVDLSSPSLESLISKARSKIEPLGNLVVRSSGTEPVVRVMVQGDDEVLLHRILSELVSSIKRVSEQVA
jgi:phosphoglucosamine mutase